MGNQDAEEHGQGVDGRVAYRSGIVVGSLVGIAQCRGVGRRTCNDTHEGEIVELEFHAANGTHDEQGDDGDEETYPYVGNTVTFDYGSPEVRTGLDTYGSQEENQTNLTEEKVG